MKSEKSPLVFKVQKFGNSFKMINTAGKKVGTLGVGTVTRKNAYEAGKALRQVVGKGGKISYRSVPMSEYSNLVAPLKTNAEVNVEVKQTHEDIKNFIHN
jgi:hypothetical protein